MAYPLGASVPLTWSAGPLDGSPVTLTVTDPMGVATVSAVSPIAPGEGTFTTTITPTSVGRYLVYWQSTGTTAAAWGPDVVEIASPLAAPLVSLADIADHLNLPSLSTSAELLAMAVRISGAIEAKLGYAIRATEFTNSLLSEGATGIMLPHIPCACTSCESAGRFVSVSEITESGAVRDPASFEVDTRNGIVWSDLPWGDTVTTYRTGYVSTPEWVREAFLRAIANSWKTSQQRPHPGLGNDSGGSAPTAYTLFTLPYNVVALLEPHVQGAF